jgi:hypothetical protein
MNHRVYPLDTHVLAVAMVNTIHGDWAAYIGSVPGLCHDKEWQKVAEEATKLPEKVAEVLFPDLAKEYEWRM